MCVYSENSWLDKSMLHLVVFFPAIHKGCDKGCVRPQFCCILVVFGWRWGWHCASKGLSNRWEDVRGRQVHPALVTLHQPTQQNTKYNLQNTKFKIQNTKYKLVIPSICDNAAAISSQDQTRWWQSDFFTEWHNEVDRPLNRIYVIKQSRIFAYFLLSIILWRESV